MMAGSSYPSDFTILGIKCRSFVGKRKDRRRICPCQFKLNGRKPDLRKENTEANTLSPNLTLILDPLTPSKKAHEAMLKAATDSTVTVIPDRVIDMTTLVQQISRFLRDVIKHSNLGLKSGLL